MAIIYLILLKCLVIDPINSGEIKTHKFESKIFGNTRKVRVYLPPGYQEENSYKVLYLNDGQNIFSRNNSLNNWRFDVILDSLIETGAIEPLIIVAIDNIGLQYRGKEYLPWEDIYLDPPIPNPQGKKYPTFLIEEVIPFIQSRYNTKPGKENRGIGGFSYGGLITAYTYVTQPDYFGFAIIESPSFYVNNNAILDVANKSSHNISGKIHLGIGTNEMGLEDCNQPNHDNLEAVQNIKMFRSILEEKSPLIKINTLVEDCATHSFSEASDRLGYALEFILN